LSNIEKHAQARQVRVEMVWETDSLTLAIADDGRGFDPTRLPFASHYGLQFMRERCERLNGSLSLQSTIGRGTHIVIHAPLE
jgi:signal transduction histidine kinase